MQKVLLKAVIAIVCINMPLQLQGSEEETSNAPNEIDIALRLIKDGYYDRADVLIEKLSQNKQVSDKPRLAMVNGLSRLYQGQFSAAMQSFQEAQKGGWQDPYLSVYMAQAAFGLEDYRLAVAVITRAPADIQGNPAMTLLKVRSYLALHLYPQALQAIKEGQKRFPAHQQMSMVEIEFWSKVNLNLKVVEIVDRMLNEQRSFTLLKQLAKVLYGEGHRQQAMKVLEALNLRTSGDPEIKSYLALLQFQAGNYWNAAFLFEQAAQFDAKYYYDAAEMYTLSGHLHRALQLNRAIFDQKKKLKQRIAILIRLHEYEKVASMTASLSRHGLLKDQSIRYALAYAQFKVGQFEESARNLSQLTDGKLFNKAIVLRTQMSQCQKAKVICVI